MVAPPEFVCVPSASWARLVELLACTLNVADAVVESAVAGVPLSRQVAEHLPLVIAEARAECLALSTTARPIVSLPEWPRESMPVH